MKESKLGVLLVVSGPSGSGKTTICRALSETTDCWYSISCTTRAPRTGERDGHDYFFLNRKEFERRIEAGDFLEHAEVHGNLYGTLREKVLERLHAGRDVVMDLDVQGAAQLRDSHAAASDVFVMPATVEELKIRLDCRGTESAEVLDLRLRNALEEMENWHHYDYLILGGTREEDLSAARAILEAERLKTARYQKGAECLRTRG